MFNDLLEYQIKNFLDEFRLSRSCYTDKLKKNTNSSWGVWCLP